MTWIEGLAGSVGLGVGLLASVLTLRLSRSLGPSDFWPRVRTFANSLLRTDENVHFVREYVQLLLLLCRYAATKTLIVAVAFVPAGLGFWGLSYLASRFEDRNATAVQVTAAQPLVVDLAGHRQRMDEDHLLLPASLGLNRPAFLIGNHCQFHCATLAHKQAYAPHWLQQLLFLSLGFEILIPDQPDQGGTSAVLVRPFSGDNNILWPYLSDWEFVFMSAVSVASIAGWLVMKRQA